ncbi:MAG: carboxypeptidase regulatory-like domain-containing protein [Vicinamibacterales bacterium]
MHTINNLLLVTFCVVGAACGGSPTGPANTSSSGGATIAGTAAIANANKSIKALSGVPAAGLSVTVPGTSLSATTNASGYFEISGVPSGNVRLQFRQSGVDASAEVPNVSAQQLVTIEVQVSGSTATIVSDRRSDSKVSLCHRTEGSQGYHMITVAQEAEAAHRAHGDAKPGERVPGTQAQIFDQNCQAIGPAVDVEKYTSGQDADSAPGPTLTVGATVSWTYVVTNTGTVSLTGVVVTDDKGVSVSCPSTSLSAGQSMTCTGAGTATLGQYRNIGRVTATGANPTAGGSVTVSDEDASHYLGVAAIEESGDGQTVELCHRTGNGSYQLLSVAISAEPAHRAHGDGKIGEAVPSQAGKTFGTGCSVR